MLPTPRTSPGFPLDKVYEPAEDTFLFLDLFESAEERSYISDHFTTLGVNCPVFMEVGCGSGVISTFLIKHVAASHSLVLSSDINPTAVGQCRSTISYNEAPLDHWDGIRGDLLSSLRPGVVDVLVFNPPYVPAEEVPSIPETTDDQQWLDLALVGGPRGMDITDKLLEQLNDKLSANGLAYVLFCARNDPEKVAKDMEVNGWTSERVIHRKSGWEVLSIYRFSRRDV